MNKAADLDRSVTDLIKNSDVLDVASELAEGKLDELLADRPLKDVPFFGSLLSLWRAGPQIRDWLFARKLRKFLEPIHELSSEEREAFSRKLEQNPSERQRAGEHLLLIIDRMDHIQKPELISRAFIAYLNGSHNFETFQRLSLAIDRCFYDDLFRVAGKGKEVSYSQITAANLASAGLIELARIPQIRAPEATNQYSTTSLGETLRTVVLRKI